MLPAPPFHPLIYRPSLLCEGYTTQRRPGIILTLAPTPVERTVIFSWGKITITPELGCINQVAGSSRVSCGA